MKFLSNYSVGNFTSYFFILLSIFSVLLVFAFDVDMNNTSSAIKLPRFEIYDYKYYKISSRGIDIFVNGDSAIENLQGKYELNDFQIVSFSNNVKEDIVKSEFAIYDNSLVYFPSGVYYTKDDSKIWSESAYYNPKNKEIDGHGKFVIKSDNYQIVGENIKYKNDKIYANNIHSLLKDNR